MQGRCFWKSSIVIRPMNPIASLAAELAGNFIVINDELVDGLLSILSNRDEPELLQGKAVISLGPVLEHAQTDGFEDPDDVPINEQTFLKTQEVLHKLYMDDNVPKECAAADLGG